MPLAGPKLTQANPIGNLLGLGFSERADAPALHSAEGSMTWRQLEETSSRLAAQYQSLGLNPGDRIASLMPNRPALIIHYLACLKAGLVATPLNYRYMPPEMDHALEVSGASLLLHHAEREQDVRGSRLASRLPKGVVRCEAGGGPGVHYEELIARGDAPTKLPTPDLDSPAFVYFTSGSTGKPKGVTHTQRTFGNMIATVIQVMDVTRKDVMLPASSFSHIGGSLLGITILAAGGTLVIPHGSDGPEVLPLLRTHRPTLLWMLPASLIMLVREHDAGSDDFSSIRICLSGGDKVSAELDREFTKLAGLPVDENYGMTEIGMATYNPVSATIRIGSIGRICPGFEMSLRDEAGQEVTVGQQGRLWVRSPMNMVGYWNNPAATAETIRDGWLDTGDVMRIDDDGYLWFCGRKKQIIVHDGSNICPQEVEEAVAENSAVASVGVVGIHDLVHGENVRAYVTVKKGAARPTGSAIIRGVRNLVGYKAPEEIVFLDEMPLNATGKVDRVTLKKMAEDRASGAAPA